MNVRRQAIQEKIEQEFGEPIEDIINGLRAQDNSWRTVAGTLGISRSTLLEWRRELGLDLDKGNKVYDPSSRPEWTMLDRRAQALGYENATDAVIQMRLKDEKRLIEVAGILKCHVNTVCNYTPKKLRGAIYNKSPYWWQVRREQARQMTQQSIESRKRNGHLFTALNDEIFR